MRAYPGGPFHFMTLETVRGAADSMLQKGVDRIYLFNYMSGHSRLRTLGKIIREAGSLETLRRKYRRFVVGYNDGHFSGQALPALLPLIADEGTLQDVRIHLGHTEGEPLVLRIGLPDAQFRRPKLRVRLNGMDCPYDDCSFSPDPGPNHCLHEFTVPAGTAHDGYNNLEIIPQEKLAIDWIECVATPHDFDELLGFGAGPMPYSV